MKLPFHHNANDKIFSNSRSLRQGQTKAEKVLWRYLRNRKLLGFKFRRQHPVAMNIVDFYCHECQLVIEVDGPVHQQEDQRKYDLERTLRLQDLGLVELRFTNEEVLGDAQRVVARISEHLNSRTLPPLPRNEIGEGA